MADKITITYIGPKDSKKDTITGSRIVFPRHKAVDVDSAVAYTLLGFPTVFLEHKDLKTHLKDLQAKEDARQAEAETLAQLAAVEAAANDMTVEIDGIATDLSKMNSVKLKTLVESRDLKIEQGPQEPLADFAKRVRDAIKGAAGAKVE